MRLLNVDSSLKKSIKTAHWEQSKTFYNIIVLLNAASHSYMIYHINLIWKVKKPIKRDSYMLQLSLGTRPLKKLVKNQKLIYIMSRFKKRNKSSKPEIKLGGYIWPCCIVKGPRLIENRCSVGLNCHNRLCQWPRYMGTLQTNTTLNWNTNTDTNMETNTMIASTGSVNGLDMISLPLKPL